MTRIYICDMKKIILLFLLSAFTLQSWAQTMTVPIQTDRPDQTESPSTVPAGHWQVELGGYFQSDKVGNINADVISTPNILTKYGISDNFEFRLITELSSQGFRNDGAVDYTTGLTPVIVGMKVNILKENRKKFIPKLSLIGHLGLAGAASEKFQTKNMFPQFRFLMQHTLTDKTALSYNIGAELYGNSPELTGIYTLALARDLGNGFGAFAELYGYFPEHSDWDHRFDAGVTYLVNRNIQLDASGGFGITENAPDYFISAGVSFRSK